MKYYLLIALPFLIWACNGNKEVVKNDHPQWLDQKLDSLQSLPLQNPPLAIYSFTFNGEKVYYFTAPCCDQYTSLYNQKGILICNPDGGITGEGDGKCPDFYDKRSNENLIWQQKN